MNHVWAFFVSGLIGAVYKMTSERLVVIPEVHF